MFPICGYRFLLGFVSGLISRRITLKRYICLQILTFYLVKHIQKVCCTTLIYAVRSFTIDSRCHPAPKGMGIVLLKQIKGLLETKSTHFPFCESEAFCSVMSTFLFAVNRTNISYGEEVNLTKSE